MGTFLKAKRQHLAVSTAAAEDEARAADLWNAIAGIGADPRPDTFAEAVRDTVPVEHAALLATDDVAAAYAFQGHWRVSTNLPPGSTAFYWRDLARQVWAEFGERAGRVTNLAEGFGWNTSAAWTQARDVELAGGDMKEIERIARLAGRMYVALRGARARRVHGVPEEVYSVEQGNNVSRLLPAELVLLTDAVLETTVLERIASRRAAQYAVRGSAKASKGPLVVALDESSSMHGDRNAWAKAAAVALARVAAGERRQVAVVHFSSSAVAQALPPGDAKEVLRMVRHFLGGGTAIGMALDVAVSQVRALAQKGDRGADIILVTDGIDGDTTAQEAAVAEALGLDVRLWTVAIECDISPRSPLRSKATAHVCLGGPQLGDAGSVALFVGAL